MGAKRGYHNPIGNPCEECGLLAIHHYVEHFPKGFPCECGLPAENHRKPRRRERAYVYRPRKGQRYIKKESDFNRTTYIGIDGEGQGREDHRYVLLSASSEDGEQVWSASAKVVRNPNYGKAVPEGERPHPKLIYEGRLSTVECLEMILELPTRRTKIFSFSFNYDITKMLTDLDDKSLYELMRPELPHRRRKGFAAMKGPKPVLWNGYSLNLQGTKFVVQKGDKRVVVWDLFKFFQAKFVSALRDWKVGNTELWDRMSHMKDKRADFDREEPIDVENYCAEECKCIGELAHRLIRAHEDAGLKLRTYYGAGSSGAAMLTAMEIKSKLAPSPPEMKEAIGSAFFGGRFENSVIGAIREKLTGWDISSAYVYQLAFLPCLEHGSWHHTKKRKDLETAQAQAGALVRYTLGSHESESSWGPFPFRTKDGSISFPIESGGGWVWLDEYLAGERIFPHVEFREAWIYSSNCNCKPFGQIPEYYNLRLKIGKEGPGIVIKLGMNSCYGKLAQSIGNALFQSWIWAGMITSGCRAQILHMMGLHKDMSNLLMVATDGILTRETLIPPEPLPTGTGATGKPLGGWERKPSDKGMFIARPGIYFPMHPTEEEIASVRARGVGRSVVLKSWETIIDAWEKGGVDGCATVANVSRFCGAKTSISISDSGRKFKRAKGKGSKPAYGQWISRKVELSFNPLPKRERVNPDGLTLALRRFPKDLASVPYDRAMMMKSKDALEMRAAAQELIEQPDGDLTEYEENT